MKKLFTFLAAVLFVGSMTATVNTGAKALSSFIHGEYLAKTAELQAVSDSTTWDFSMIAANTENAFYSSNGIKLTTESTPNKDEEVVYANYSADYMTFGEGFDATTMAFKGEFPICKNQYCQAGTLHFKAEVPGTIVVKFSDTGSSASASAVKRYLVVNNEQTEYWTSRPNNGVDSYEAKLNVISDAIEVPAGDVTITGSSAIIIYFVTFVPAKAEGPKNLGEKTIAEFLDLKNAVDTCVLTGVVTSITNTTYGNLYLADETGTLYVYGVLTPAGESKKFETLGVEENDTLTVKAIYGEYNGNPQAANAIFVDVKKYVEPSATYSLDITSAEHADYTVTVGGEIVDGEVELEDGDEVVITATPEQGYEYAKTPEGWTKLLDGTGITATFTVSGTDLTINIPEPKVKSAGIEDLQSDKAAGSKVQKVLVDGVMYIILPDGGVISGSGARVK